MTKIMVLFDRLRCTKKLMSAKSLTFRMRAVEAQRLCMSLFLCLLVLPVNALDWESGSGFRNAKVSVAAGHNAGFSRLASANTGLNFTNWVPESRHLTNQILLNGSGVAAGDIDGDGWCDLYFSAIDRPNRLYRHDSHTGGK